MLWEIHPGRDRVADAGSCCAGLDCVKITELGWNETHRVSTAAGDLFVRAFRVNHWGARLQYDNYRGYNGYVLEREGRRVVFAGDTAFTKDFEYLRDGRPCDLAIMGIGAYQPWIRVHCNPEQAVAMANAAGARHIMPVHHQTFKLSFEPFREPIERFVQALAAEPSSDCAAGDWRNFCRSCLSNSRRGKTAFPGSRQMAL